jgi:hypothetical protein
MKYIDRVPPFALKTRILMMMHLMVMSPSSTKTILVLSFDFGLIGSERSLIDIRSRLSSPTLCLKCVLFIGA